MNFKSFMAEFNHEIDFSPVVAEIDSVLQHLKKIEPHIDQPMWVHSKPQMSGHENVIYFFYKKLHELREAVSRGAHSRNLASTIKPLYNKINTEIEALESKAKESMTKFHVKFTFAKIKEMIEKITKN